MDHNLELAIRRGWHNNGTLPPNWEQLQDSTTRKPFFVDHNTQSTTWVDPRDYLSKPRSFENCVGNEFPYGWEESFDDEVGVYYTNHNEWTTQIDDPRLNSEANQQRRQLSAFIRETEERIQLKRRKAKDLEEALRLAQREFSSIRSKLRIAAIHEPHRQLELLAGARKAQAKVQRLEEEIEALQQSVEREIYGFRTLQDISRRTEGRPYTIDEARRTLRELRELQELAASKLLERQAMERSVLEATGLEHQVHLNEQLREELDAIRGSTEATLASMKQQLLGAEQSETAMLQQWNKALEEALTRDSGLQVCALDEWLSDQQEYVRLKDEESHYLQQATGKMKDLVRAISHNSSELSPSIIEMNNQTDRSP